MGLLDQIRAGTFAADETPPLAARGGQLTLRAAGRRIGGGEDSLMVVREFFDQAGRARPQQLEAMIAERPEPTGQLRADALLAAAAEYTAGVSANSCPGWTAEPERFLDRFWFVSTEPGFRAIAIAQTPVALKRRGILWPARSLRRV